MREEVKRGVGAKRCVRLSVSVTTERHRMLKRLAVSLDMTVSELIDMAIGDVLNSSQYVSMIQDRYNKNDQYRVYPVVNENGRLTW